MIEYNIASILAGNVFLDDLNPKDCKQRDVFYGKTFLSNLTLRDLNDEKTMGYLIVAAKQAKVFDSSFEIELDEVKKKRDYYVHVFFKEDLFQKLIEKEPDAVLSGLNEAIKEFTNINQRLLIIDKKQRAEALEAKERFYVG